VRREWVDEWGQLSTATRSKSAWKRTPHPRWDSITGGITGEKRLQDHHVSGESIKGRTYQKLISRENGKVSTRKKKGVADHRPHRKVKKKPLRLRFARGTQGMKRLPAFNAVPPLAIAPPSASGLRLTRRRPAHKSVHARAMLLEWDINRAGKNRHQRRQPVAAKQAANTKVQRPRISPARSRRDKEFQKSGPRGAARKRPPSKQGECMAATPSMRLASIGEPRQGS